MQRDIPKRFMNNPVNSNEKREVVRGSGVDLSYEDFRDLVLSRKAEAITVLYRDAVRRQGEVAVELAEKTRERNKAAAEVVWLETVIAHMKADVQSPEPSQESTTGAQGVR